MESDPAPLLAEARDLCALIILEDAMGTVGDEAFGRGVRAMLGRVRTLMIQINSPPTPSQGVAASAISPA